MRKEFVEKILSIMQMDPEVVFFTGDLGFGSFEVIQERYPERYYNMGIAEQNMIGTACGLGLMGKKVIIYSIANFATLRVLEQIRNYLIYHNIKALIVNGGGGFSYGQLGYTHHSVEDISVMKSLPYIDIYAPFDKSGIDYALDVWLNDGKVAYLRLEKSIINQDAVVVDNHQDYQIIGDIAAQNIIVTYGGIVSEAIKAVESLKTQHIDVTIIALCSLKRVNLQLIQLLNDKHRVAFLEENMQYGGVAEALLAQCYLHNVTITSTQIFAVKDFISDVIGDQDFMRNLHKISAADLITYFSDTNVTK
jgi:transketolase